MRIQIVAGNWKMNLGFEEGLALAREISHANIPDNVEVILGIPFPYLKASIDMLLYVPNVSVAAQDVHHKLEGAFTGDVSAIMLSSISCQHVIIGHSERRQYHHESNVIIAEKVSMANRYNMNIIFCCGENLDIRKNNKHIQFVTQQIFEGLFHLTEKQMSLITIAYEPIWAIGTGETATANQAEEMHAAIRKFIAEHYNESLANSISILYGGSVKPNNAKELFTQSNVDGALVGGASLKAKSFVEIISSFE